MRIARLVTPAMALVLLPIVPLVDSADRDPPGRVGRLSFLSGSVSFRPGGVDSWGIATANYPLTTGDDLWTDADSRAEITVGSSAIRLAQETAFGLLALDDRTTQIRLSQGTLQVRLRDLDEDEVFEIDTPNGAVSLLRTGAYRVHVDSTGDTTAVTVRRGQAEFTAAGAAFPVRSGEVAIVAGIDAPSYDIEDAPPPDAWEDWCGARDRRWDDARSARYVSRDMIGYEDLDDYGDWQETDPYGAVWVPRTVVAGWAPYRYGHWAWIDPWGWTWIDDAPWGFAPFHYGRWVYVAGGWAWVPGRRVLVRPVYAPALVVFLGGRNGGVVLAVGGGSGVAWFPLAPDEPYIPAYRVSETYVRNVNVTNVDITNVNVTNVNVTNITYRNRSAPGAVTVVSRQTFVDSRPVGRRVVVVQHERLASAPVVGMAPSVAPGRRSVLAQPTTVVVRRPPPRAATRVVVTRATPPPAPVPFTVRERVLRAHPGRPLDDSTLVSLRTRTPVRRTKPLVRPATPPVSATERPSPALTPAREGLPAAKPLPAAEPARQAVPQQEAQPPAGEAARPARPERRGRVERPAPAEPKRQPAEQRQPPAERQSPPARRAEPERKVEKEGKAERAQKDTVPDQGKRPK